MATFSQRIRTLLEAYSLPGRRIAIGAQTPLVLLKDDAGLPLLVSNNVVPVDATAGYAKGCIFIKTDAAAGTPAMYENKGTTASCLFRTSSGGIAGEDAYTTTRETNVDGLSSAITLANEARLDFISHAANAVRHPTGQQSTAGIAAAASTLATLLTLTGSLLTLYAAHNADAILAAGWAWHSAQVVDHALVSAVAPTTLQDAITKLIDLKAKYNLHEAEAVGHAAVGTVAGDEVAAADAAYGAAILVPVTGVASGDKVSWAILNPGTGAVTGVSAASSTGAITFTFSADPQNDCIISYSVMRL